MPDSPPDIGSSSSIRARTEKARITPKAMASEPRLPVLELLSDRVCNVREIGEAVGTPPCTATMDVNLKEGSGIALKSSTRC